MKGYLIYAGYMGWIPSAGRYILFATESDYEDYYKGVNDEI